MFKSQQHWNLLTTYIQVKKYSLKIVKNLGKKRLMLILEIGRASAPCTFITWSNTEDHLQASIFYLWKFHDSITFSFGGITWTKWSLKFHQIIKISNRELSHLPKTLIKSYLKSFNNFKPSNAIRVLQIKLSENRSNSLSYGVLKMSEKNNNIKLDAISLRTTIRSAVDFKMILYRPDEF